MGGAIGAYFDYVDENRNIARELGGINLLIQNIKNNFHGIYSDWAYEPVLESLYGLSSGTWLNQDIAAKEGAVPLHVKLISEHGGESKIAEETLQAVKARRGFLGRFLCKRNSKQILFEDSSQFLSVSFLLKTNFGIGQNRKPQSFFLVEEDLFFFLLWFEAMIYASDDFRHEYSKEGMFKALTGVFKNLATDRGAVSLSCDGSRQLLGMPG